MSAVHPETRKCPEQFQERLTRMFGRNQFGDPHFKIVWGQSEFQRMGSNWRDKQGNERSGYVDRYKVAGGLACWCIMRWHAPFEYGSPYAYYRNSWMTTGVGRVDEEGKPLDDVLVRGFHVTGEYPWRGRYEVVQPLISKEVINGQLIIEHFSLSHMLIDTVIPMIEAFRALSLEEQRAAREIVKQAEEKEQTEFIADVLEQHRPTWFGPVSRAHQTQKNSVLQRKMEQIQKVWDRWSRGGRPPIFSRGMQQGNRPIVRH